MFDIKDLIDNPTPRLPIAICLDVSSSMTNVISELQRGVEKFKKSLCDDEVTLYSAEVSIITFGDEIIRAVPFGPPDAMLIPKLKAFGQTPLGEATLSALQDLENRKNLYAKNGIEYFQPWIVIMTDGDPTDSQRVTIASQKIAELVAKKKLTVFIIMIGDGVSPARVASLSPNRPPIKLQGARFEQFFEWLSSSASRVSASTPGDTAPIPLDIDGLKKWATL